MDHLQINFHQFRLAELHLQKSNQIFSCFIQHLFPDGETVYGKYVLFCVVQHL